MSFKKNIYLISGLGADRRVFQYLDWNKHAIHHIEWVEPIKNESISQYTGRLIHQIKHENPILIGVSFGGVIAGEIALHIPVDKIIIISSIKSRSELPWIYKALGPILLPMIPKSLLNEPKSMIRRMFRISQRNKQLFYDILSDTDKTFLKWAMLALVKWRGTFDTKIPLIHIHGSKDYILPAPSSLDHRIEEGGHFMIVEQAKEVNSLIHQHL